MISNMITVVRRWFEKCVYHLVRPVRIEPLESTEFSCTYLCLAFDNQDGAAT